ncbi:MAG: NifB/NifX family molybdenum-iron cluster-binding protein [Acidobacteriota bacterium]|jgi:predicted Fe-Mo cluster-binding NifX family protein|nr:NifB/NifX family molybdenum-iron cluster-binding protein [Acidobacteriota bacterium]NLT32397.1 diguanylate cyclase [Acidobacteriota bacterium]
MKVGFPIETDNGMDSKVYGHFGSAPAFLIVDTELDQATTVGGSSEHKEHGACNPVKTLGGNLPDALVTGGIGMGAIMRLGEMGVKIYRAAAPTVGENLALLKQNGLQEFSANDTCKGHEGGCAH